MTTSASLSRPRSSSGLISSRTFLTVACAAATAVTSCSTRREEQEPAPRELESASSALGFSEQIWAAYSEFRPAWFDATTSHLPIWTADVNADGTDDFVGVNSGGDVWVMTSTGSSFSAPGIWRPGTIFQGAAGWLTLAHWSRISLSDVTGDGRADLVGIASDGGIWVSESTGTTFEPSRLVAASAFSTPAFFERSLQHRVFLGDVDGDGRTDILGISTSGQVLVSRAIGAGTAASFARSAVYLAGSIFVAGQDWFRVDSHPRVWLADITGDGRDDLVGVDFAGGIWASESLGTSFRASRAVAASALETDFGDERLSMFGVSSHPRVWLADLNGDGRKDLVGIASGDGAVGLGDGDVWGELATGSGSSASFSERVLLSESLFRTSMDWFRRVTPPRVWVDDVTGDGRADLVGIANDGDIWVAQSAMERATAGAPAGMNGTRDFFLPAVRTGGSSFSNANGYFGANAHSRLWLGDFTGSGVKDFVAVAPPGQAPPGQNALVWRMAAPASPLAITELDREDLEAGTPRPIQIQFSRRMQPGSLSLSVQQDGVAVPVALVGTTDRTTTWNATFTPKGSAPTRVSMVLDPSALDAWGQYGDLLHDQGAGPGLVRQRWWHGQILAGSAKVSLTDGYPSGLSGLPFPSGYGYCPATAAGVPVLNNPLMARVVVMAGGGACSASSDCRAGQTCVSGQCQVAGADANAPLVMINADLVGINSGRLGELIARRYGIPKQNLIVAATHTHAAIRNLKLFLAPYFDDRIANSLYLPYQTWLEDRISDAVGGALATLSPVEISAGSLAQPTWPPRGPTACNPQGLHPQALGFNRRHNSYNPLDREVKVVKLRSPSLAVTFVNYALHPVVEQGGPVDDPVSDLNADFPGYMAAELEGGCGSGSTCAALFLNGSAGDVNPVLSCGTSVCPPTPSCPNPPTYYENAPSIGQIMAGWALGLANSYASTQGMSIAIEKHIVEHPGYSTCGHCAPGRVTMPVRWDLESTAFSIGVPGAPPVVRAATVPGEPFSKLALDLKAAAPGSFLIGYANGYAGYLPDREGWNDRGGTSGYGVDMCDGPSFLDNSLVPTAGEKMISGAAEALQRL